MEPAIKLKDVPAKLAILGLTAALRAQQLLHPPTRQAQIPKMPQLRIPQVQVDPQIRPTQHLFQPKVAAKQILTVTITELARMAVANAIWDTTEKNVRI